MGDPGKLINFSQRLKSAMDQALQMGDQAKWQHFAGMLPRVNALAERTIQSRQQVQPQQEVTSGMMPVGTPGPSQAPPPPAGPDTGEVSAPMQPIQAPSGPPPGAVPPPPVAPPSLAGDPVRSFGSEAAPPQYDVIDDVTQGVEQDPAMAAISMPPVGPPSLAPQDPLTQDLEGETQDPLLHAIQEDERQQAHKASAQGFPSRGQLLEKQADEKFQAQAKKVQGPDELEQAIQADEASRPSPLSDRSLAEFADKNAEQEIFKRLGDKERKNPGYQDRLNNVQVPGVPNDPTKGPRQETPEAPAVGSWLSKLHGKGKEGVKAVSSVASSLAGEAQADEAEVAKRIANEVGKRPEFFTWENLALLFLVGAPRTFQKYLGDLGFYNQGVRDVNKEYRGEKRHGKERAEDLEYRESKLALDDEDLNYRRERDERADSRSRENSERSSASRILSSMADDNDKEYARRKLGVPMPPKKKE